MCLEISGNTTAGSTNNDTGTTSPGINLRKQGTDPNVNTFGIDGMTATASPGVETYVNGLNTSTSGTFGVGGTALLSAASGFTNCSMAFSATGALALSTNDTPEQPLAAGGLSLAALSAFVGRRRTGGDPA